MHNLATRAARFMAICGGLVLALLILLICISVVGRSLNGVLHGWIGTAFPAVSAWLLQAGVGPINGDFELVDQKIVGEKHLKCTLKLNGATSIFEGIAFFQERLDAKKVKVAYKLNVNSFRGNESLQLMIESIIIQ